MVKKSSKKYFYAVGRRKSASATVKLFIGKDKSLVNDKLFGDYFPTLVDKRTFELPFKLTDTLGKYYAYIRVSGSGKISQLEAVALATSRALQKINEKYRPVLKAEGLLTVDARVKERSKPGQAGRARAKKQSPKR